MSALINDGKGGKIIWCRNCERNIRRLERWLGIKLKRGIRNHKNAWMITGRYSGEFEVGTNYRHKYSELTLYFEPGNYNRMRESTEK